MRNTSRTSCSVSAGNQLIMSTPIYHPNSTSFKMIDAKLKPQYSQNVKHMAPDMRHR